MLYVNYINKTGENNILKSNLKGFWRYEHVLALLQRPYGVQRMTVNLEKLWCTEEDVIYLIRCYLFHILNESMEI